MAVLFTIPNIFQYPLVITIYSDNNNNNNNNKSNNNNNSTKNNDDNYIENKVSL